MPNAVWSLLLVVVVFVLGAAFFKSELFGHVLIAGFIFAVMAVLHHYTPLVIIGDALQVQNPYLRWFLFRSSVTVGAVAPLALLALAWAFKDRLKPWLFYSGAAAVAFSGLWTGYDEFERLAPYYPRLSLVTLLGSTDLFAVVGAVIPVALRNRCRAQDAPAPARRVARAARRLGAARAKRLVSDRAGPELVR